MIFYVGICNVCHAGQFDTSFISINRLRTRKSDFHPKTWILDSGAFTEVSNHGRFRTEPESYATEIERWKVCGQFECAVSQDWMCEQAVIEGCPKRCRPRGVKPCGPRCYYGTGLSVAEHQRLTVERYDRIRAGTTAAVMPVLQGFTLREYLKHLEDYGDRLRPGMRVGIGSVCKRNVNVGEIEDIIGGIYDAAPGLLLHGFGLKTTALASDYICSRLFSADSMAWSYAARKQKTGAHNPANAKKFVDKIATQRRRPRRQKQFELWPD